LLLGESFARFDDEPIGFDEEYAGTCLFRRQSLHLHLLDQQFGTTNRCLENNNI
jgi:hypothetical protein